MPAIEDNSAKLSEYDEIAESAVTSTSADGHSVSIDVSQNRVNQREARNRNAAAIAAGKNRPVSQTINLRNAMGY